jgi:hypothetical protein
MGKYRITTEGGVYEIETEDTPAATNPRAGLGEAIVTGAKDVLGGMGAGVFSTLHGTGQLLGYDSPYLKELATPPQTLMGQAGKYIEQGAEYLLPGMGAAKGTALLRNAPQAVRILGRAGLEAAGAGVVAALQSGGDPEAVRNAALLGGGVSAATGALPLVAPALKESALTQYARVLNPTKEKAKIIAEKIRPEMLKRGTWGRSLGTMLENTQGRLRVLGQQIDDAWEQMSQAGVRARIEPLLKRLDDFSSEEFHVATPSGKPVAFAGEGERAVKEVEAIKQNIIAASEIDPATGERVITSDAFIRFRRFWDKVADKAGGHQKDIEAWIPAEIKKEAADIARSEFAAARPDIDKINKEFSFLKDQEYILKSTMLRRVGQQKPLTRQLMKAAGTAVGAAGGATGGPIVSGIGAVIGAVGMDALQTVVSSPAWGTLGAVSKNRLAEALAAGHTGQSMFYLNQLLRAAGMPAITRPTERGAIAPAPAAAQ